MRHASGFRYLVAVALTEAPLSGVLSSTFPWTQKLCSSTGRLMHKTQICTLSAYPAMRGRQFSARSLCGRMGTSRIRSPVAWKTALATAGATLTDLPDPLSAGGARRLVHFVHPDDVRDIGVYRQRDPGEVFRKEAAETRLEHRRRAPTPDQPTDELALRGLRIRNAANRAMTARIRCFR
jgi:hypothetical protein